ncbi:hypothetical protein [Burkholderia sp. MSMB1498]|uniref:hypothetical protein n=1 Tax=Burkholderia sp. MSMB1498 TaxID=1637842 RepID=UPI00075CBDEA|nr:hypothetical protein [Burkholderia sp. MSMB1498]KVK80857.1 hypothetical protein WS91_11815 [Burkholderia sp. MSMB1498]
MKMNIVTRTLTMSPLMLAAACSQMPFGGTDTAKYGTAYIKEHLVTGVTTQEQVRTLYGNPDRKMMYSDGGESWDYDFNPGYNQVSHAVGYLWGSIPKPGTSGVTGNAVGTANQGVFDKIYSRDARKSLSVTFKKGVVSNYYISGK